MYAPPIADILRDNARPLEPLATGVQPRLPRLVGIEAVLFDVYGTLFISRSGELGTTLETAENTAWQAAWQACGVTLSPTWEDGAARLRVEIARHQQRLRDVGTENPEVDIVEVWRDVAEEVLADVPTSGPAWDDQQLRRLAAEYESRTNPVWPMPGLQDCLHGLRQRQLPWGIISNAQFYTPLLFEAFLAGDPLSYGWDPTLHFYSYRALEAKPGIYLYKQALAALAERGLEPHSVLYLGNDMLNDMLPAQRLGFRTALFAGDQRSLRPRTDDPRVAAVVPDAVITELKQLELLLGPGSWGAW